MSRVAFGCLIALALALALAFRLPAADLRPMHHDEANQAVKFGTLLETGDYQYDKEDHHGPTLYYLTLPVAWARGQSTLASLDEHTLRVVPAIFGAGLILLFLLGAGGLGREAVAASAMLCALSPVLTYYSRFYIQESLLAFFTIGFLFALGRYVQRPGMAMACWAGVCAGFAYATKETSVILLPSAVAAAFVAHRFTRGQGAGAGRRMTHLGGGIGAAVVIALAFYSSCFRHPSGVIESVRAFSTYLDRGVAAGAHAQPWDYYLRILAFSSSGGLVWTEGLVLALALVGLYGVVRRPSVGFWPRYVALYAVTTAIAFSLIRYKTPWNLLPFYVGCVLLAGQGAAALVRSARSRVARAFTVVALLAAAWHLGVQDWRANFRYPADPRNPYVYAQTSPDFLRLARRVTGVAAVHPDGNRMLVKVVAGPYEQWPLPWYLRRMTRVGYWSHAAEAGRLDDVPVIIASQENTSSVSAAVGEGYISEFYGIRPDVLLIVYVDRTLWSHFLK
jgi:uncharacterized protein (TIGR03663 family)